MDMNTVRAIDDLGDKRAVGPLIKILEDKWKSEFIPKETARAFIRGNR